MKILMQPIEMYCVYDESGRVDPLAFRWEGDDFTIKASLVVKERKEVRIAGNFAIDYLCDWRQGERLYSSVIRWDRRENRWYLYKI